MDRRILASAALGLALTACDTADPGPAGPSPTNDDLEVVRLPDTFDREAAVRNAQAAAQVLAGVASDPEAVGELESLVRATKGPHDEAVRFIHLLRPEDGAARVALNVTDPTVEVEHRGAFADAFRSSFGSARLRNARAADGITLEELEAYLIEHDMQVYWPNPEDWDGETAPVVTFDPMNDQEENVAYRLAEDGARVGDLVVDEAYAAENPTWVVNISEIPEASASLIIVDPGDGGGGGGGSTCPAPPSTEPDNDATLVKVGWFKTSKNWDSWFNGGSEIYVTHPEGKANYLNPLESEALVTTFYYHVHRADEDKWINMNHEYISNWKKDTRDQKLMMHEQDPYGPFKFSGSVKFKIPIPGSEVVAEPSIGFEQTFKSNDPVIFLRHTDRDSYFLYNRDDIEAGTKDCWRVYKGGSEVLFTLPYYLRDYSG